MITLNVNGKPRDLDIPDDMPLLWTLRDVLNMTGTKFGCGVGLCGACTIHIDEQPTRSCDTPVSAAVGKRITTIEAIENTPAGKKVQAAWLALDVPQCGYCQSGQIMSASALLAANPKPSDVDIDTAMAGNICRCATVADDHHSNAQTIRAILLASAMAAILLGRRANNAVSHGRCLVPWILA